MKRIIIMVWILIVGCQDYGTLSNKDIVKEISFCKENGLRPLVNMNIFNEVYSVVCLPRVTK